MSEVTDAHALRPHPRPRGIGNARGGNSGVRTAACVDASRGSTATSSARGGGMRHPPPILISASRSHASTVRWPRRTSSPPKRTSCKRKRNGCWRKGATTGATAGWPHGRSWLLPYWAALALGWFSLWRIRSAGGVEPMVDPLWIGSGIPGFAIIVPAIHEAVNLNSRPWGVPT